MNVTETVAALVKTDLVEQAKVAHQAACTTEAQRKQEADAAHAAHRRAQRASETALATGGDAHAAELELEAAERLARVAGKIATAATTARGKAAEQIDVATQKAYAGVIREGIKRRVAAVRKAAELMETLRQVGSDYADATSLVMAAHGQGGLRFNLPPSGQLLNEHGVPAFTPEYHDAVLGDGGRVNVETGETTWIPE
jgi:hypothetical protein